MKVRIISLAVAAVAAALMGCAKSAATETSAGGTQPVATKAGVPGVGTSPPLMMAPGANADSKVGSANK